MELLVASVILALGLLGAFSMVLVAQRAFTEGASREWAALRAKAIVDSLAASPLSGSGATADSQGSVTWQLSSGSDVRTLDLVVATRTGDTLRYSTALRPLPPP